MNTPTAAGAELDAKKYPQAFPFVSPNLADEPGMTLLDYFAAAALQGMIASDVNDSRSSHALAKISYEIADEMLNARNNHIRAALAALEKETSAPPTS